MRDASAVENLTLSYGRLFLNGKSADASQSAIQPATSHGVLQPATSQPTIRPVVSISLPLSTRILPVKPVRDSKKTTNESANISVKPRAAARTTRKSVLATGLPNRTIKEKRSLEVDTKDRSISIVATRNPSMNFKSASTSSSKPNSGQTNSTKLKSVNNPSSVSKQTPSTSRKHVSSKSVSSVSSKPVLT
eukprot:956933_1